jgi:two-component system sensor histidine kinase RstB
MKKFLKMAGVVLLAYLLVWLVAIALKLVVEMGFGADTGWGSWTAYTLLAITACAIPLVLWVQSIFAPLREGAEALRAGELDRRVPVELGSLNEPVARAFNEMAQRVGYTIQEQEHLIQLFAHESRTPLARMRFELEALRGDSASRESVGALQRNVSALECLVDEVLDGLAAASAGPRRESIALNPAVMEALSEVESLDRLEVELDLPEAQSLWVAPASFRRCVMNLAANAAKHAKSKVRVGASVAEGSVTLDIDDDGPGIDPQQRAYLLEPFNGGSGAAGEGLGLGLTLASRICSNHGQELRLMESELGGTRVRTLWSINDPDETQRQRNSAPASA